MGCWLLEPIQWLLLEQMEAKLLLRPSQLIQSIILPQLGGRVNGVFCLLCLTFCSTILSTKIYYLIYKDLTRLTSIDKVDFSFSLFLEDEKNYHWYLLFFIFQAFCFAQVDVDGDDDEDGNDGDELSW